MSTLWPNSIKSAREVPSGAAIVKLNNKHRQQLSASDRQ
jgi:hypothetical protein